jgi:PPK2 family polyphosphate:nucleotide phosphotransferase
MTQPQEQRHRRDTEASTNDDIIRLPEYFPPSIAIDSPYLVPFDGSFDINSAPTSPPDGTPGKKVLKEQLEETVDEISKEQRILWASKTYSMQTYFESYNAGGKDSTIRKVTTGVNPAGFEVYSFGKPSTEELLHSYRWRGLKREPERGRIGIFNRGPYGEVLVVRVNPELLLYQGIPGIESPEDLTKVDLEWLWNKRFLQIVNDETAAADNGALIVKFWLHVSEEEQRNRLVSRIDNPDKNWKFENADAEELDVRDELTFAAGEALRHTSRPWAPWYCIPADDKPFMQLTVAKIILQTLKNATLEYPEVSDERRKELQRLRDSIAPEE